MQPIKQLANILAALADSDHYLFTLSDLKCAIPEHSQGAFGALFGIQTSHLGGLTPSLAVRRSGASPFYAESAGVRVWEKRGLSPIFCAADRIFSACQVLRPGPGSAFALTPVIIKATI
jgi:hypothetical protein